LIEGRKDMRVLGESARIAGPQGFMVVMKLRVERGTLLEVKPGVSLPWSNGGWLPPLCCERQGENALGAGGMLPGRQIESF
jgi:hypothetical protein